MRQVDAGRWKAYVKNRGDGASVTGAAKKSGISYETAQRFEARDPTSSGARFFPLAEAKTTIGSYDAGPIPLESLGPDAKRALDDFDFFRRRYLGNVSTPWQLMAAEQVLEKLASPDRELNIFSMPPGTGKTTFTHDLAAWMTCRNRALRGLVGSDTSTMAERMLGRLKRTFERKLPVRPNEELVSRGKAVDGEASLWQDFGRFKPEKAERWARGEFIVEQHGSVAIDEKESTWTAYGRDSSENLGMRYEFIVWDDLVNKKNMRTADGRQNVFDWWEDEAVTRLEPGGLLILLGQRISSTDLYRYCLDMRDIEERPVFHQIVYPAHNDARCDELKVDGLEHHKPDSPAWPEGCLLDPYRVPWRELSGYKRNRPEKYHITYQQEDMNPSDVLVDPVWISGGTGSDGIEYPGCWDKNRKLWEVPAGLTDPVGIATFDPSPTKFWAAQAYLFVPSYEHTDDGLGGLRYFLDIENKVMDAPDLLDFNYATRSWYGLLEEWWQNYKEIGHPLRYAVVEINAAQRFLLQYDHARRWATSREVQFVGHATHSRNKLDEKLGIPIVGPHWQYGRYRLPGHNTARAKFIPLISQVTHYPDVNQDDQVMANWFLEANLPNIWVPPSNAKPQKRPSWLRRAG